MAGGLFFRKVVMKIFGIIASILLLLVWGMLFVIKQPIFFTDKKIEDTIQWSDSKKLEEHVKILSSGERFTDIWLEKASIYILSILKEIGIDESGIVIQEYSVWDRNYHNIIVRLDSISKKEDLRTYVVWAHYDGHGLLPWADDNASWVAGLLEIARILPGYMERANKNVELVFYSTEEMPNFSTQTMWSYIHAAKNQNIELAIILEMIWYFSDEKWSQSFPINAMKYLYSDTWDYIALVSNFSNFGSVRKVKNLFQSYLWDNSSIWLDSINAPSLLVPQISFSDHSSYWKFWVPALMITDTAFLRNKNYHTPEDTYEKLDYERMKEVVDATVYTILYIDK